VVLGWLALAAARDDGTNTQTPNRTVARLEASLDEKGVNYKEHDICIVAGV
jgi:hypothetical protein